MTATSRPTDPSRRQVLCGLVVALLAPGALAACGDGDSGAGSTTTTTGGAAPTTGGSAPTTGGSPGDVQAIAQLSDVPVGGGTIVDTPRGQILLVQPTAGEVKGYNPMCTHQGFTVDPPEGDTITCPNHGSQFSTSDGSVKTGPAAAPLESISVRVEGGAIVLA